MKKVENPEQFKNLIASVYTASDRAQLYREVEALMRHSYATDTQKMHEALAEHVSKTTLTALEELLQKTDVRGKDSTLRSLRAELDRMRLCTIVIATEPYASLIEHIGAWVKSYLGYDVYIRLMTNRSLIGGAMISFGGAFVDTSIRKKLDGYFQKTKIA